MFFHKEIIPQRNKPLSGRNKKSKERAEKKLQGALMIYQ